MGLATLHAHAETILGTRAWKFTRFLIAGGTAAATNLVIFFVLVQFSNTQYLRASVVAFVLSMTVSFTLQKFWTFRDSRTHDVPRQFTRYSFILFLSLLLNIGLLYVLVEVLLVWTLLAQTIAVVSVALFNYFGYQYFVFHDSTAS